jgi:DNA-binding transcriptional LysR family regulator
VAVADAHAFRAAARELGYTQSAVSHQIAALERALGAPLLTRPGGRAPTQLTAAGERAYRHARRALQAVEGMRADARAIHTEHATLRVGVFQAAAATLLPSALALYRRDRPNVTVALSEPTEEQSLAHAVAEGALDLAVTINPEPDDRLEAIPLLEDAWIILARNDSEVALAPDPSFELLDDAALIAWRARWATQAALEDAWRRRGIAPRIIYRTDDNLALQRFVAAGLGYACMGVLASETPVDPRLRAIAPRDVTPPRTVALIYPRGDRQTSAAQTLIELFRTRAHDLAGARAARD